MRYRIENSEGRIWDTTDNRWRCATDGRYNSYKSPAKALSVARRIKHESFRAYENNRIVEDTKI